MSCEISDGSPFGDAVLENNLWQNTQSPATELDPVAEFNATFGTSSEDLVDPQLLGNTSSTNEFAVNYNTTASGLDQTLSPEPSHFGDYPELSSPPTSPYFRSVEANRNPLYQPSPLRNQDFHRRSVSEPPGGPDDPPQSPPMIFHRLHHFLGMPEAAKPIPLKSLPRNKTSRQHPYQRTIPKTQFRPGHHRAHTQPMQQVPTSSPMMHHIPQPAPPQPQYIPQAPMMREPQYVSSRICTPTPGARVIDPALSMPNTPTRTSGGPRSVVQIPVTVDELRNMIFEAVQQALERSEAGKKDVVAAYSPREVNHGAQADEAMAGTDEEA